MTERLLQYIWQQRLFNCAQLQTTAGQEVSIIYQGMLNTDQGPDFLNAQVKVGDTTWVGSIELHILASEWDVHDHSSDDNYKNVVLHVVWKEDKALDLSFPTLELQHRIPGVLLHHYDELMLSQQFIPCEKQLAAIEPVIMFSWKQRLSIERLQQRALLIKDMLKESNNHWEETFWWMIAAGFGLKVNTESFEMIARSIPLKVLAKHKTQQIQLEALLLGQAGILDHGFQDAYPVMLRKEYEFLRKKYGLKKVHYPLHYLRMRPANFPTIRLAQLAALVHQSSNLFSTIRDAPGIKDIIGLMHVTANDYWHYHYRPDELSGFSKKKLGAQMINSILINTVIPAVYAYGYLNDMETYKQKAVDWLEQTDPEINTITKQFSSFGVPNKSASDSQALIHLKKTYCNYKNCLSCAIGNHILSRS